MKLGDTFLRKDSDFHLWIILSDPSIDPDHVLLVNMTSWDERKESACLLHPGDHPFVRHLTCINYNDFDTVVTSLALLYEAKDHGALTLQEPLSPAVLVRVLEGAAKSERLSLEKAEILEQQGLIQI